MTHAHFRLLAVALVTAALVSFADPPKPRVMVILDTSKSMTELPSWPNAGDQFINVPMTSAGGDYDPLNPVTCQNKFCAAKQAVYQTLPQFTDDARIGFTTYYQYVLNAEKASTLQSQCYYDVLAPAGLTRTFSTYTDLGNTAYAFPGGITPAGGSGGISGYCAQPPSFNAGTGLCTAGDPNCYQVTRMGSAPADLTCVVQSLDATTGTAPVPKTISSSLPRTTASNCVVGYTYSTVDAPLAAVSASKLQYYNASLASCPAVVPMTATPSTGVISAAQTANPPRTSTGTQLSTVVGPPGTGWYWTNSKPNCSTTTPCTVFSNTAAPVSVPSNRIWWGFFDPSNNTNVNATFPATSGAYDYSDKLATPLSPSLSYGSRTLTGNTGPQATNVCTPSQRLHNNESLSAYGITFSAAGLPVPSGFYTDESPTISGTTITCKPGFPCDLHLDGVTTLPQAQSYVKTVFNNSAPLPPNQHYVTAGNNTTSIYLKFGDTTCPTIPGNSALPADAVWYQNNPTSNCTGTGDNNCSFSSNGTGSYSPCSGSIITYDGSTPSMTCSYTGQAYALTSGPTAFGVYKDLPAGTASCPAYSNTFADASAASSAGYVGCGGYPCAIANPVTKSNGATQTSAWQNTPTPTPSGFTGAYNGTQNHPSQPVIYGAKSINATDPSCPTALVQVGSYFYNQSYVASGTNQVDAEGHLYPEYWCKKQPIQFRWSQQLVRCTYTGYSKTFQAPAAKVCKYKYPKWNVMQDNPDQYQCNYSVNVARFDFTQEATKYCEYWMVDNTIKSIRTRYDYSYQSKGTEIIGRGSKAVAGANVCAGGVYDATVSGSCPQTIANCTGVNGGVTQTLAGGMPTPFSPPAGSTCMLQYGGKADTAANTSIGPNSGRYARYIDGSQTFSADRACEAVPLTTTSFPRGSNPVGFCNGSGTPASWETYLVSDWYDPNWQNDVSAWTATFNPAVYTHPVTTSNTRFKSQGYGGVSVLDGGLPSVGMGAITQNALFIPIPNDATYDQTAQEAELRRATSKCVLPTSPDSGTVLTSGACISNLAPPEAFTVDGGTGSPYCNAAYPDRCDFTPLYGALESTGQYLNARWADDDDAQECRDYFIVLATDGDERSPKGYTISGGGSSVANLVGSLRNTATGPKTRPDIRTFVIGFGENISTAQFNQVAVAGGTNTAFFATDLTALQAALNTVFTTITQGVYARSRPALATDGTRLYATQYIRPSNVPDWSGLLTAYALDPFTGAPVARWEHGAKLDDPAHPARNISVGLYTKATNTKVVGPFTTGNSELKDQMDDWYDFPGDAGTSADVITFLRTNGQPYWGVSANRTSALGPLVFSSPVVVGKSPYDVAYGGTNTTARNEYNTFIASTTPNPDGGGGRPTRVLVQGDDGMLHAVIEAPSDPGCAGGETPIGCPSGTEAWAFVPGSLPGSNDGWHGQPTLVESLYNLKQGGWSRGLLDNTLSVADICWASGNDATNCTSTDWKTIAIGSQRGGGRGVYALDVTTGAAPSSTSAFLWDYNDNDLGLTYSVPAVGRVKEGGKEVFVAVFGGGKDDPGTFLTHEGRAVYVLRASDGHLIDKYTHFNQGPSWPNNIARDVLGRPATWRRPNQAFMDSAYIGAGESLYALRFTNAVDADGGGGVQSNNSNAWRPDEFFDPTSWRNASNANAPALDGGGGPIPVNMVALVDAGTILPDGGIPPTYGLAFVKSLPLTSSEAPPIYNRPKLYAAVSPSGSVPDLYVGTGDVANPDNPSLEFRNGNYFYAIHDDNRQPNGPHNDGEPLWVVKFPNKEQVVSEPAFLNDCVVVATFTPLSVSGACGGAGDTTLYGFDPLTGALRNCLKYPAGSPWGGQNTPVVQLTGVGIPSDLVVVNDHLYLSTGGGATGSGLRQVDVSQSPPAGAVRSFRRIR